ncbi:hypothetical protein HDU91_000640, partial [Kappamyces sp. JEL0680]
MSSPVEKDPTQTASKTKLGEKRSLSVLEKRKSIQSGIGSDDTVHTLGSGSSSVRIDKSLPKSSHSSRSLSLSRSLHFLGNSAARDLDCDTKPVLQAHAEECEGGSLARPPSITASQATFCASQAVLVEDSTSPTTAKPADSRLKRMNHRASLVGPGLELAIYCAARRKTIKKMSMGATSTRNWA